MNYKKEALDYSGKKLDHFPDEVFKVRKLRKLFLRNNRIKVLPREIAQLNYLETLDLSNNQISNLYAKIFELRNLKILILDKNQLINLPKQIGNLTSLKILSLSGNRLMSIPKEISQLKNLEELNISNNWFTSFPKEVLELNNLRTLWVSKNKFENFPIDEIKYRLTNLKRIYCYSYQLEDESANIDNSFVMLSKVKGNCINFLKRVSEKSNDNDKVISLGFKEKKMDKNKIFISYAHTDKHWLERIRKHMKVLKFEGLNIEFWDDTRIKSGEKWKEEIKKALDESYISILLVSTDFLASDFINTNELPPLLKSAEENGTKILPLLISPSRFLKNSELSQFQAINDPSKTLVECNPAEQERVLIKLTEDIEEYISSYKSSK